MSINTGNKTDWYGRTSGIKTGDDYVVADGPPLNATVLMDTYVFPTRTGQFFDYTFQWLITAGNTWASIYNAGFVSQFDSGVQPGIIMSFTNGNNLPAGNHFYGGEFSLVNMADFDLSLYYDAMEALNIIPEDQTYADITHQDGADYTCRVTRRSDKTNIHIQMEP